MTINTRFNKGDRVYINLVPMTIWFTEITDIMVDGGIVKYCVKTNYDPAYIIEDRCFSTSEELIKSLDVVSVLKGKS